MGRELRGVGRELRGVGRELRGVGRELRGVGRELRGVGRELRGVGRELRGVGQAVRSVMMRESSSGRSEPLRVLPAGNSLHHRTWPDGCNRQPADECVCGGVYARMCAFAYM